MQITDEAVLTTLREVVAERPEYVYERPSHMPPIMGAFAVAAMCLYVHTSPDSEDDKECGCLVAHVFHRLGVPLDVLETYEGQGAGDIAADFGLSEDTTVTLEMVQGDQDTGRTWGQALTAVDEDTEGGDA